MLKIHPLAYAAVAGLALVAIVTTAVFAPGTLPAVLGGVGTVVMAFLSAKPAEEKAP